MPLRWKKMQYMLIIVQNAIEKGMLIVRFIKRWFNCRQIIVRHTKLEAFVSTQKRINPQPICCRQNPDHAANGTLSCRLGDNRCMQDVMQRRRRSAVTVDDTKLTLSTAVSVLLKTTPKIISLSTPLKLPWFVANTLSTDSYLFRSFFLQVFLMLWSASIVQCAVQCPSLWQLRLSYLINCLVASSRSKWALLDKCHPQTWLYSFVGAWMMEANRI